MEGDAFPLLRDEATDRQARALAVASSTGQNHVIRELLGAGVDPDLLTSVGTPALWRAAFNDHLTSVKLLLDAGGFMLSSQKELYFFVPNPHMCCSQQDC